MITSLIVATDINGLVGKGDKLPWNEPVDMQWFINKTRNKAVVMGARTCAGIGKALPNRLNMVVASMFNWEVIPDIHVVPDLYDAIQLAKNKGYNELVICGGPSLYKQAIKWVDKVYLTVLDKEYEGDVHLDIPEIKEMMNFTNPKGVTESCFVIEHQQPVDGVGTFTTFTRVRAPKW